MFVQWDGLTNLKFKSADGVYSYKKKAAKINSYSLVHLLLLRICISTVEQCPSNCKVLSFVRFSIKTKTANWITTSNELHWKSNSLHFNFCTHLMNVRWRYAEFSCGLCMWKRTVLLINKHFVLFNVIVHRNSCIFKTFDTFTCFFFSTELPSIKLGRRLTRLYLAVHTHSLAHSLPQKT